jgi:hypothetical protein
VDRAQAPQRMGIAFYHFSLLGFLALAPDVAGLGLAFSGVFNIECQPIAFANIVGIDARRLQRGEVEKRIRTARIVSVKPKPRSAFHIFNMPVAIPIFPSPSAPAESATAVSA